METILKKIKILCLGDVVGKPGRQVIKEHLAKIQKENDIHFTIVNIENVAGGHGITTKIYQDFNNYNIQAYTSGNHIYNKKESINDFNEYKKMVRPLNYLFSNPGVGYRIFRLNEYKIAVVNLVGRVFMGLSDCPFQTISRILPEIKAETNLVIVDFHAETTSEKQALGWFLDGKVSTVFGTHTHVITADERILPQGTGYITDIGMVGARDSVIGMEVAPIIEKFITQMPVKYEPPTYGDKFLNGIILEIDTENGKTISIERIQKIFE